MLQTDLETALEQARGELESVRAKLAEEVAYYRAELEASRRRWEKDSTRTQAEEIARRRQLEQELAHIRAELQQAQKRAEHLQQANDELMRTTAEVLASQAERERKAVAAERDATRVAWQDAEQELARQERDLGSVQCELAELQKKHQALLAEQSSWEMETRRAQQAREDSEQLVVSLKRALWNTAHARRQAETALSSLRFDIEEQLKESEKIVATASESAEDSGDDDQPQGYHEVSEEALQTVFFGDLSMDLADDFVLTAADASLDSDTVDRLRSISEPAVEVAPPPEQTSRTNWPPPLPAKVERVIIASPSTSSGQRAAEQVFGGRGGMRRLLVRLIIIALATGMLYWLAVAEGLEQLLLWMGR